MAINVIHKNLTGDDLHDTKVEVVTGAPSAAPSFIGEVKWDQASKKIYVAIGTTSPSDWTTPASTTFSTQNTGTVNLSLTGPPGSQILSADVVQAGISITSSQITDFASSVSSNTDVAANTAVRHNPLSLWLSGGFTPLSSVNGLELDASGQILRISQDISSSGSPTFASLGVTNAATANKFTIAADGVSTASSLLRSVADGLIIRGFGGSNGDISFQKSSDGSNMMSLNTSGILRIFGLTAGVMQTDSNGVVSSSVISGSNIDPDFGAQPVITSGGYTAVDNSSIFLTELESNGTDYIELKAPASVTASYSIVFPASAPGVGTALTYNGTNYIWQVPAGGGGAWIDGSENINNNVGSPTTLASLVFDGSTYRSVTIEYSVYRSTDSNEVSESGNVKITYKTTAGTWLFGQEYIGDQSGVTFSVTNSGEIQYISSDLVGSSYAGIMKFSYLTTSV